MSTAQAPLATGRSVFKGALQGTVVYAVPTVVQRLASILVLGIVTHVLTTEDFGMLSLLDQVTAVLTIFLGGNFSAALGYFYVQKDSENGHGEAAGTCVAGAFLLGCIGALVCWPATGFLARSVFLTPSAILYLPIVYLCMPVNFAQEALFGWLRIEDRQAAFAKAALLRTFLVVAGIAVLVGIFKMRVMAYLSTSLAAFVLTSCCLAVYLFRVLRPRFSYSLFVSMFRFSLPLGISMIAMFVINFGDQFVLRHYRSLSEVGIYSLGYRIGMLVAVAYASFHSYWSAQVYRIMQMDDSEPICARLLTYATLLVSAVTLLLTVSSRPGLHLLVNPAFRAAAPLIPVIAAANGIRSLGEFLRCRFLAAGRSSYEAWCDWAGMILCCLLYFILIPRLGMWGGAIATIATFIFMLVISIVWTYRLKPYRVESRRLLKLGIVVAVIAVLYYAVPVSSLPLQIAWAGLLMALLPAGLWVLRFPTPGEWQAVRNGLQRVQLLYSTARA
jgi:O-antigen/teichoic acid export membrane protein